MEPMLSLFTLLTTVPVLLLIGATLALGQSRRHHPRGPWLLVGGALLILGLLDTGVIVLAPRDTATIASHLLLLVGAGIFLGTLPRITAATHADAARLQRFAEATLEGVAFVEQGQIIEANARLAAMLGLEPAAIVGLQLDRIFLSHSVKPKDRIAPQGYDRIYEARARRRTGGAFPVEVLEGSSEAGGRHVRFLIIRDITDQRKTEELFRESEESFRELAESVTQVFFAVDPEFHVTYWNKASEYLTGVSSRDAVGKHLFRLLPSLEGTVAEEAFREVLHTRDARHVSGEFVLAGEQVVWEVRVNPSRRGLSIFLENVTLRTRAAEALRESEERFRRLADHAPGMIYRLRPGPPITLEYASPASMMLTGYEASDLTSAVRPLEDFILPEDRPAVRHLLDPGEGEGMPVVLRWVTARGAVAWLEHRTSLVRDEGGRVIGGEGIAIDITGRIEAERKITASLEEKEALLKEIHHRVKNNLQIISSLLSLQSEYVSHAPALEALKESQGRIRSMAMIHEQLYRSGDLARIEFDSYVRDLTNHLLRTYSVSPGRISLKLQVAPLPLGIDKAIPCGIIINELVSNSLKHAFSGRPRGSIEIALRRESPEMLVLSVRDDGVGLPPEFRIEDSPSLGMKLVHALSDQLRGTVRIIRGEGTQITLRFPG
jgi:PAS domain S-box-containing protein